jgi:purine-binding chemotaxis protein CheW
MSEANTGSTLFLTFRLGDELFALDVSQVREVLELDTITGVPNALEFMRGVINVRGSVVPVIDLRAKFGMEPTKRTVDTRIVVIELNLDGEMTVLGALADSVHEVIDLQASAIEPPPSIGSRWRTRFIQGIGKKDEEFILLLDIDKVFSLDELVSVQTHAAAGEDRQLQQATVQG